MSGHIRRRGERSWELKFDIDADATGKRTTRYHSFRGTKREAQAELIRLMNATREGTYIDPAKTTLGTFLDRWERDWAALNVGFKTLERYVELLRVHVRPNLGALPVQKLQPAHLAELYTKLLREGRGEATGLSPRTVGHVHRVMHKVLTVAMQWSVVHRNVASAVKPPKAAATEIEILSEEQARQILQALRGQPLHVLVLLGLTTGMRRGELLALRWSDINFDDATLRVEQSLEETKAGVRFKEPKTRHGRRTIGLATSVVAELRSHWKQQQGRVAAEPERRDEAMDSYTAGAEVAGGNPACSAAHARLPAHRLRHGRAHHQSTLRARLADDHLGRLCTSLPQ
jgi:integrase